MKTRIAEFHGPEQLKEAGETLLNDLNLDGAIVRDAASDPSALNANKVIAKIARCYNQIPELHDLDKVVHAWSEENLPCGLVAPSNIMSSTVNNKRKGLHIDKESDPDMFYGPLSISIRIDPYAQLRRFFDMRRIARYSLTPGGEIDLGPFARYLTRHEPYTKFVICAALGFSTVEQRIGDALLIPNYPFPSIHQVRQPEDPKLGRPAGLLLDYMLAKSGDRPTTTLVTAS